MLPRDYVSNYLKQHDQMTLFLIKIHIVNIIKGSKFNWCSSHKLCIKPGFPYTANTTTTTQKQSDYNVGQSSFTLIALF